MKPMSELHFSAAVFPRMAKTADAQWTASDSAVVVDDESPAVTGIAGTVPAALTFLPLQPSLPGKTMTSTMAVWDAQGKLLLPTSYP
jgi:hypothetical protein